MTHHRSGNGVNARLAAMAAALLASIILPGGSDTMAEEGKALTADDLIEALGLEGHVEGGFFRRTYEAQDQPRVDGGSGERFSMTSIFYLLTAEGPVGHFHRNQSDIVHYFHSGDPIEYVLIHADGELERIIMGPDPRAGHRLQLTVGGGIWKASRLMSGQLGYGLISEAVSPGFDYADMTLGVTGDLVQQFPQHKSVIRPLSRAETPER